MKYILQALTILSSSASVMATNIHIQKPFHDWDDAKDDDKGPSEPKDDDKGLSEHTFEMDFANEEQYRCRIGGQPCNYLASCCDGFSCQPSRHSFSINYCVATTAHDLDVVGVTAETAPDSNKVSVNSKRSDDVDNIMSESFVESCRPYGHICSSSADCCDGTLCLDVTSGAGLFYCLNLGVTAETAPNSNELAVKSKRPSLRGENKAVDLRLRQVPQDEAAKEACEKTCDAVYQGLPDYAQQCKVNSCNLPKVTKEMCEKTCDFYYQAHPDYAQECKVTSCSNLPDRQNTVGLRQVPLDFCEDICDFVYQDNPDAAEQCKDDCNPQE